MDALHYDRVPYPGQPLAATSPAHLALASRVHGGPLARLDDGVKVLELGCGDGANLLGLAFHHPSWSFVGIDGSRAALEKARAGAEALGLSNLRFELRELAAYEPPGELDYVLAHGVYSWVDPTTRAAMRAGIARALAPGGIAYVSFNAQPGWSVRGRVRDALVRHPPTDLADARQRLGHLSSTLSEPRNLWSSLLADELTRAHDAPDAYLAHEYLAPHNAPFWLGEVVSEFADAGLAYLGDADFATTGWVAPELRRGVGALSDDPIAREEWIDLLAFRQHRAAAFARSDAERRPAAGPALLDDAFVATAVRRRSDPFDLSPHVEEPFDGHHGHEIRVRSPLLKVALLVLADRYPEGWRLGPLLQRCRSLLAQQGLSADGADEERLRGSLWQLFERREVELRMEGPRLRSEPGERPEASALSRFEARRRLVLSTPLHTSLPLEPVDRELIWRLDGTRTLDEVTEAVVEATEAGEIELEGAPSGAARLRPLLRERAERAVTLLGWWGLV